VDSEAQWREIQERQGLQQSQTATVRPAASSTPVQQQPVQQATVRKATTNAVNVSTSSANDSLLDQSQSDLTTVETNSQVSSSRHRHHRKHNHRHHHKHRYQYIKIIHGTIEITSRSFHLFDVLWHFCCFGFK
jgi:G3E family GTPase